MRILTLSSLCIVFLAGMTSADVPDPAMCYVDPWDETGLVFVTPGNLTDLDRVTIVVRNAQGMPIVNANVEVDVTDCTTLCVDPVDSGLSGTTDTDGTVVLGPSVGGCEDCDVVVRANGVTIRIYSHVTSTDLDADGAVAFMDFVLFAECYNDPPPGVPCCDYDGDGPWLTDFVIFATSFNVGEENPNGCP
jgi:hypothetical protein